MDSTDSMTVVPTLPHATALTPPACNMAAVSSTVEVFPFVPVRLIHFWAGFLTLQA